MEQTSAFIIMDIASILFDLPTFLAVSQVFERKIPVYKLFHLQVFQQFICPRIVTQKILSIHYQKISNIIFNTYMVQNV